MISKGVRFGDIHSFDYLDLILEPFVIPPAIPKTNLLDIPAGDGSLDLTEALGEIRYNDREFLFRFTVNPLSEMTFDEKVMQVSNLLNGKAFNITLDRDPEWFWEGRCEVNEHLQNKTINTIVIKAIVRPYKLKHALTNYTFKVYSSTKATRTVTNSGRKTVCPKINCEFYPITLTFEGETYVIDAFEKTIPDFLLKEGDNEIGVQLAENEATSSTRLFLEFREGAL